MDFDLSLFEQHLEICEHAFADALNCQKFFGFLNQIGYLLRQSFYRFGGVAIGANTEGVLAVDLEQIGGFVEDAGYGFVIHLIPIQNNGLDAFRGCVRIRS